MSKKKTAKTDLSDFARYGTKFTVLIPCRDDETGKQYETGAAVSVEDFTPDVLENWLEIGVIEPAEVE